MKYEIGKIFKSKHCGEFEILRKIGYRKFSIRFVNTGYITETDLKEVRTGEIKDRSLPLVYGIGIIGKKYPSKIDGKVVFSYSLWKDILRRVTSDQSYKKCGISDNFKAYEYFHEWCLDTSNSNREGWEIDKDLFSGKMKIYSEDTCVFLPSKINNFLVKTDADGLPIVNIISKGGFYYASVLTLEGIPIISKAYTLYDDALKFYFDIKCQQIRLLAKKYKGELDAKTYDALINYRSRFIV